MLGNRIPPHLECRESPPPHPPLRRAAKILFFPLNTSDTLCCRRQHADAPSIRGESATITPYMKGKSVGAHFFRRKSAIPPREGNIAREKFKLNQL